MSEIEYAGSFFGLLGALLLGQNSRHSGWGFVSFFVSNIFWIAYAVQSGIMGLFWMQIGFMVTSVIGIYNWHKKDARHANHQVQTHL